MAGPVTGSESLVMKSGYVSLAITLLFALLFLALQPVHAQTNTAPTVAPQEGSYVVGQSVTVGVTWGYTTGDSYTVSLYASPTDSCLGPFTISELVKVTSGSNPAPSQTGPGPTDFTFTAPNSNLHVCAKVTDTGPTSPNSGLWSGPASYFVAPQLTSYNTNEQNSTSIDLGQSVLLTDYPSGGAPPYKYQWSGASSCSSPITGATSVNYTVTPSVLGPNAYSVVVSDSSIGAHEPLCEVVTVTVNAPLTGTFVIDGTAGQISGQAGSPPLTAVVTFSGGTGPWYAVTVYSGTEYTCSKDTTVVGHLDDISGTEAILSFPEPSTPSSITYYCATLTDSSAGIPTTAYVLGPIQVDISPPLSTPAFSISTATGSASTDYGQPRVPVTATVTWSGGTSPYNVTLYSGSQQNCAGDYNRVGTISQVIDGVTTSSLHGSATTTYSSVQFTFLSPQSSAYYCAVVTDGSLPPSVTFSSTQQFTVQSLFAVNAPALSTAAAEVLTPMYEGNTITATVTWSGGTGPYAVSLYNGTLNAAGTVCTPSKLVAATPGYNPQTGLMGTSATFSFLAPNAVGTYCYYATVTDVVGTSVTSLNSPSNTLGFATLVVSPAFTVPTVTLAPTLYPNAPDETDTGQTESVTATVTWSGGSAPYAVTLYEGGYSACSLDTTPAASPQSGIIIPNQPVATPPAYSATFTLTSPPTTTFYCAKITDSSVPMSTGQTVRGTPWTVSAPPSVSLPASYEIAAGGTTSITATVVTPGSAPDYLQWFTGSTCAAVNAATKAPPASTTTYSTGLLTAATTYSVQITDSSHGTPAESACASITISVNNGPMGVAADSKTGTVYVATPYSAGSPSGDSLTVISSYTETAVSTIPLTAPTTLLPATDTALGTVDPWGVAVDSVNNIVYVTGEALATCVPTSLPDLCTATPVNGAPATGWTIGTTTMVIGTTTPLPSNLVGDYLVWAPGTANAGQYQLIISNTASTITTAAFSTTPNLNDAFSVVAPWTPIGVVVVISVTSNAEIGAYWVGQSPEGVALNTALGQLYVANSADNTVSVFSASTSGALVALANGASPAVGTEPACASHGCAIVVGAGPESIAVDQKTYSVFVTDNGGNTVTVIQPNNKDPTVFTATTEPVGSEPVGVAVDPLTDNVYVANYGSGTVSVLNGLTYATNATINVGGNPTGIGIDSAAVTAYVANAATNAVTVINLATNTPITPTIPVGGNPFGVAILFNPSNLKYPILAYITNQGSNTVTVINPATGHVIATIVVPLGSG